VRSRELEGVSEGAVRKRAKAQGWKRDSPAETPTGFLTGTEEAEPAPTGFLTESRSEEAEAETPTGFITDSGSEEPEPAETPTAEPAESEAGAHPRASIRLKAHMDPTFRDAFRIFLGGALFAIGRQPEFAAASRLLEEGLATRHSKFELVFVDAKVTLSFTVGDVVD
jgi:hypothetical protein